MISQQIPHPDVLRAARDTFAMPLLPIESLKDEGCFWVQYVKGKSNLAKIFLSSGTTQRDRSQSPFSRQGLEAYKDSSTKFFWEILGHFFEAPKKIAGWSFIPPPQDWPDSSLAQMVAWIGEESEVHYSNIPPVLDEKPIWVFATAFHLVQWADAGHRVQLPQGSIVIETGGTKGKSRSVSREELYRLIEQSFGIPEAQIISEYGMCEMASQAYDFVAPQTNQDSSLGARFFRFPSWVKPFVIDSEGQPRSHGVGILCIEDAVRIDLPWALKTEDLALLREEGTFRLLGRAPLSPLKGCSLLAEDTIEPRQGNRSSMTNSPNITWKYNATLTRKHAERIHRYLPELLVDSHFADLLYNSLQNKTLVDWCLSDIKKSMPKTIDGWVKAALAASSENTLEKWLILLPNTHVVAGFYPLLIAGLLGLKIQVKPGKSPEVLEYFCKRLMPDLDVQWLPTSYRVPSTIREADIGVFVFGSDETISLLADLKPAAIKGFGHCITGTLLDSQALEELAPLVWKDALSLGQVGCLSSRTIFVISEEGQLSHNKCLDSLFRHIPNQLIEDRSQADKLGSLHSEYAWRKQSKNIFRASKAGSPLLITMSWSPTLSLSSYLLDRPWALPIVFVEREDIELWKIWAEDQKSLKHLTISRNISEEFIPQHMSHCHIGNANAPEWNGLHLKVPLFAVGCNAGFLV